MDFHTPGGLAQRPGAVRPRGFDANLQAIASAAHTRGVVLMRGSEVVGTIEAADLCKTIRFAREQVRSNETAFDHIARLANGIAAGLGTRGSVIVNQSAWNLVLGYAAWTKGRKPPRE